MTTAQRPSICAVIGPRHPDVSIGIKASEMTAWPHRRPSLVFAPARTQG